MKIYFCGSIRGGYQDADLYQEIIAYMKRKHVVLTEHIGKKNIEKLEEKLSDEDIYKQDISWLKESDIVIAECTTPSLGVGYEVAFAEKMNKPTHILYDMNRANISAMLSGDEYFKIHAYKNKEELFEILNNLLNIE